MKAALTFMVLIGLLSDMAHKCDFYFVGNVDYRGRGQPVGLEDKATLQGCKKGCFWNETYTDDGVPKCEKCSEIKNEDECLKYTATCQWKSGKCISQSCPSIAKTRVSLYGGDPNDNNTREAQYRDQIKKENECIEGSALEQKYNNLYWEDYRKTWNYQYAVWNIGDTCTVPGSTVGGQNEEANSPPYSWAKVRTNVAATNEAICKKFIGYTYTAASTPGANPADPPVADPIRDTCIKTPCVVAVGTEPAQYEAACKAIGGCIFVAGSPNQCVAALTPTTGVITSCTMSTTATPRWTAGTNTSTECESNTDCIFVPGEAGQITITDEIPTRVDRRNIKGLTGDDQCLPKCAFTAGTNTQKDCEQLGCTYHGGGEETGRAWWTALPDANLKTTKDEDNCDTQRLVTNRPEGFPVRCGINETLGINHDPDACDDRTMGAKCSLEIFTTEEDCKKGHGIWTPPDKGCRPLLYNTQRLLCEFKARDQQDKTVYVQGLDSHGGNQRPGTWKERCIQDLYDEEDEFTTRTVVGYDGVSRTIPALLTEEDREKIYGYRKPEDWCQHQLDLKLQNCQRIYDAAIVTNCRSPISTKQATPENWARTSVQIRASRSACHRIYGCMYSRSNERCSVWAVWAFILTLIFVILVFVVALGVGAVVLLSILRKSSA